MTKTRLWLSILGLVLGGLALACTAGAPLSQLWATPTPTATATPLPSSTALPTATPWPVDTGWQSRAVGVEARALTVQTAQGAEHVAVVRLDPAAVRFRVLYASGAPRRVSEWAQQSGALLVFNGGYFSDEFLATGLLISDGARHGVSYDDFAGMLAVTAAEEVTVRWLRAWPYDSTEPLREALQCFPVLVKPGGVMGFPADADDGRPARRTVVAQDRQGRILALIAPRGIFSLHTLAVWLTESDLDVDIALNLDGGGSSGLWLSGDLAAQVDSGVPVPVAVAVYPR